MHEPVRAEVVHCQLHKTEEKSLTFITFYLIKELKKKL